MSSQTKPRLFRFPTIVRQTTQEYIAPHAFEQELELQQGRKRYHDLRKATAEADTASIQADIAETNRDIADVDYDIVLNRKLVKEQELIQSEQQVTIAQQKTLQGEYAVDKAQYASLIGGVTTEFEKQLMFLQGEKLFLQVAQIRADNESKKVVMNMQGIPTDEATSLPLPPTISAPRITTNVSLRQGRDSSSR